jgi:hypothetical protein
MDHSHMDHGHMGHMPGMDHDMPQCNMNVCIASHPTSNHP